MIMNHSIEGILKSLVQCASITPYDAGCQAYLIELLGKLGFKVTEYNNEPVNNFVATIGSGKPHLMFAGHTDVVTAGDMSLWRSDPFNLAIRNDYYFGRGVADMKGSLASMVYAVQKFLHENSKFSGTISFLITSGEEGEHYDNGTPYVIEQLKLIDSLPDYCIIGEPSSNFNVGDQIKIGRRGSLNGIVRVEGKQGHVAYPHLAKNPIHQIVPALNDLLNHGWDVGNEYFPPTSFQITHINAGEPIYNVIPQEIIFYFNFRYSNEISAEAIQEHIEQTFAKYNLQAHVSYKLSGLPFLTKKGTLIECAVKAIEKRNKIQPQLSTSGGTSDGRFIAPLGIEVIELGPSNATIHQIDECVGVKDLETLAEIYYELMLDILKK